MYMCYVNLNQPMRSCAIYFYSGIDGYASWPDDTLLTIFGPKRRPKMERIVPATFGDAETASMT